MQPTLSTIQSILSDWYLLSINNPLYAAVVAIVVCLLTAMLYSIRIGSLKKKITAGEQVCTGLQNNLDSAQQKILQMQEEMQQIQEELTANKSQMEKYKREAENEAQRALGYEKQIFERNKQIAGVIENLSTHFYFSERPTLVTGDIKAEGLWQQFDNVITQLTERLLSVQQTKLELQQDFQVETAKRLEQEALMATLQTTIATQASQISGLEQAFEEQKSTLQLQLHEVQQTLSSTLENHQADLARITDLGQKALELVDTKQRLRQLTEQLTVKEALIAQLEINKSAEQVKVETKTDLVIQDENAALTELNRTEETQPVFSDIQQASENPANDQPGGIAGKFKNLFGKPKQQPVTEEPELVDNIQEEVQFEPLVEEPAQQVEFQPELSVEAQPAVNSVNEQFGKIRNLFGGKQQQAEETVQEEIQPEFSVEAKPAVNPVKEQYGKIRNLFGGKQQQAEETVQEEVQPELSVEAKPAVNPVKEQFGKIRNLFGGKQQQAEETVQEEMQPEFSVEAQPAVNSVKEQFGKIRNLFGGKQQIEEIVQSVDSDKEWDDDSAKKAAGFSSQLKGFYRKFTVKSE
ncbi:MAG: hypothetical protein ACXWTS_02845 [Methylococcaceae bacterium]